MEITKEQLMEELRALMEKKQALSVENRTRNYKKTHYIDCDRIFVDTRLPLDRIKVMHTQVGDEAFIPADLIVSVDREETPIENKPQKLIEFNVVTKNQKILILVIIENE